jgi:hypothetical protein
MIAVFLRGVAQVVERLVRDQEAAGSSPVTPTIKNNRLPDYRKPIIYIALASFYLITVAKISALFMSIHIMDHNSCRLYSLHLPCSVFQKQPMRLA